MPPWHADPRHGEFGNERRLTPDDVDTIAAWVESGSPPGVPEAEEDIEKEREAALLNEQSAGANPANPDPKQVVRWGDQTWDEMMIGYVDYDWEDEVPTNHDTQP